MKDDDTYDDFESWERDYELIEKKDWKKLLEYRTEDLQNNPIEYSTIQRYLEALNYNKYYSKVIKYVKERHEIHNEDVEIYNLEI